jgi:hypothetical protein
MQKQEINPHIKKGEYMWMVVTIQKAKTKIIYSTTDFVLHSNQINYYTIIIIIIIIITTIIIIIIIYYFDY